MFAGGWSLEAAEAICADGAVPPADVLDILSHLVEKSLVVVTADGPDGRSRYRLLEPIRQYAREQLVASGELDPAAERHATYFLAFAEAHERDASRGGARRSAAADALEAEYPNLQVALRRALDTHAAELGLRLASTLRFVWKWRGVAGGAGRPWLEDVLALPGAEAPTPARAVSLLTAADLAWMRGDYPAADGYYAEAGPLARRLGDPWILTAALDGPGMVAQQRGDYETARTFWQKCLAIARASEDRVSEAMFLVSLGRLDIFEANYATGRPACEQGLAMARQIGDTWIIWGGLHALALAALAEGNLATARTLSRES